MDEKSLHQMLMDKSYELWNQEENKMLTKQEILKKIESELGELHKKAFIVGVFISQVLNGGFMQWYDNNYSNTIHEIIELLEQNRDFDIVFSKIIRILIDVNGELEWYANCDHEAESADFDYRHIFKECCGDKISESLDQYDNQFYKISDEFTKSFNRWLYTKWI